MTFFMTVRCPLFGAPTLPAPLQTSCTTGQALDGSSHTVAPHCTARTHLYARTHTAQPRAAAHFTAARTTYAPAHLLRVAGAMDRLPHHTRTLHHACLPLPTTTPHAARTHLPHLCPAFPWLRYTCLYAHFLPTPHLRTAHTTPAPHTHTDGFTHPTAGSVVGLPHIPRGTPCHMTCPRFTPHIPPHTFCALPSSLHLFIHPAPSTFPTPIDILALHTCIAHYPTRLFMEPWYPTLFRHLPFLVTPHPLLPRLTRRL